MYQICTILRNKAGTILKVVFLTVVIVLFYLYQHEYFDDSESMVYLDENAEYVEYNETLAIENEDKKNSKSSKKHLWKRRAPQAIIFGVQKGGTAALKFFLDINSHIRISLPEEVHFFDNHYKKGKDWYIRQMPKSWPKDITIEKTPNYFNRHYCIERIWKMNPDIKLITILRNPVDRAVSNYEHNKAYRDVSSFKEVILKNGKINPNSTYVSKGIYHKHLKEWYKYFSKEQILILDGDAYVDDPLPILRKVESFLGVPHEINRKNLVYSKAKGFYCKKKGSHVSCLGSSKGRKHHSRPDSVMKELKQFYKPHNKELLELTGMKFKDIK